MKNIIRNLSAFCLILSAFCSCDTDLDNIMIAPTSAPGNFAVDNDDPLVCSSENAADTAFVFSWSPADFGRNITSTYSLQFSATDDFSEVQEIAVGNNMLEAGVTSDNLNTIMHGLGMPIDVPSDLLVRVKARPMVLGSSTPALPELYSESVQSVNVTSYALAPFHLLGSMFGAWLTGDPYAWDITNYRYVMFRDDPLSKDTYTGHFLGFNPVTYEGQIKFQADGDLGTYTQYGVTDGKLSLTGANVEPAEGGYYTITCSLSDMSFSMVPYDASGAVEYGSISMSGSAVNGTVELEQAFYDAHIWSADNVELTVGEAAFESGSKVWVGTTFPWGKDSGNGSINITKAGTYYVKFCDLTGHYVFYEK